MQVLAATINDDAFRVSHLLQEFASSTYFRAGMPLPLLKTRRLPWTYSLHPFQIISHSTFISYSNTEATSSILLDLHCRYVSYRNHHMSMVLHFPSSSSACYRCRQGKKACISSSQIRDEHSDRPLTRCKMASPARNRRKSLPVNLANADILLDQPAPDHSTRALLSNSMGDATVNGDMPSSSFLSVSTLSSTSTS